MGSIGCIWDYVYTYMHSIIIDENKFEGKHGGYRGELGGKRGKGEMCNQNSMTNNNERDERGHFGTNLREITWIMQKQYDVAYGNKLMI